MGNAYDNASLIVTPNAYKASKIYSLKPTDGSGDLSFSRASTALRRNSAGLWESVSSNVPRLQYPVGGGCPSWLFEPQSSNIFLASRVDDDNWFSVGSTKVLNSIQSPFSGYLATKLVEDNLSSQHLILAIDNGASNATHTISFYAKTNGRNIGVVNNGSGSLLLCSFDLTAGTGSGTGFLSITDAGNGWWLCVCQYNPSASPYNIQLRLLNGTNATYLGDGVSGAYVWGTQYELGGSATSPIITTGSIVTRLADTESKTIPLPVGTFFVDFTTEQIPQSNSGLNLFLSDVIDGFTSGNSFWIRNDSSSPTRCMIVKRIGVNSTILYTLTTNRSKIAINFNGSVANLFVNGVKVVTNSAFTATALQYYNLTPNVSQLIGNTIFYPNAISDTEAINLTTL
jgi:hypothetical protein